MEGRDGRSGGTNRQWLCVKWPSSSDSNTSGCKLEAPWLFKTLSNVSALAVEHFERFKQGRERSESGLTSKASSGQELHRAVRAARVHRASAPTSSTSAAASISKLESGSGGFTFVHQQLLPQLQGILSNLGQWGKKKAAGISSVSSTISSSKDELGELEERALGQALARRKPATIIEFYSPKCTLCRSLVPVVEKVESKHEQWLHVVMVDAENRRWLPEVLLYDIKYVPCFLLLDAYGNALAKTGVPYSRHHVLEGLSYLLESMQPIRNRVRSKQTLLDSPSDSQG